MSARSVWADLEGGPVTPRRANPVVGGRVIGVGWRMIDVDSQDETQAERAMRALQNIANGANVTDEAMKLSNQYTDRHFAKMSRWFWSIIRLRR